MSDMNISDNGDQKILSRSDGEQRANDFINSGQVDPFPDVEPALLSADEIMKYVEKTGAISPFYCGGRKKSRLKKASYEGRIGRHAYKYNDQGNLEEALGEKELTVEANSIVFVECDLDFRLPDFIAIRFNLQIRHVHRGILLGTGPLVDPGFWGKLCIPLHNLTDKDYAIPRSEGLIWVELTKTSSSGKLGQKALSTENKEFWDDIRDYIYKAAQPFDKNQSSISIRSSIPLAAKEAKEAAQNAEKSAEESKKRAEISEENVKQIRITDTIALVAVLLSIMVLIVQLYSNVDGIYDSLVPEFRRKIDTITYNTISNTEKTNSDLRKMSEQIDNLVREKEEQRKQNSEIQKRLLRLESSSNE